MLNICKKITVIVILAGFPELLLISQISPGELSSPHSACEGISNCTKCHVLGNKVSVDKCLACHTEIKDRIGAQKGYHSSSEVKGKLCFSCHSEHNGKNFQLIRLNTSQFDHNLTGYKLSTPHAKQECRICHSPGHISDQKLKSKKNTYLGVNTDCLNCHTDYHRQTLSSACLNCHSEEAFRPAPKFDHSGARFQLKGKHKTVECIKCHKTETVDGKKFQEFRGLQFGNCTNCHKDPHQNKFGQNCRKCHTENSFAATQGPEGFNHSTTGFPLEEKHLAVDCKACHKGKLTDPLNHDRCTDCHSDYHKGEFALNGISPDCSHCHSVSGFTKFSFTLEQHNSGRFRLRDSHEALPCTDCHRKQGQWSFRNIGIKCSDCHKDIHLRLIEPHYYPEQNCRVCHNEKRWSDVTFDHSATKFPLTGAHTRQSCRTCHFRPDATGIIQQKFYELNSVCTTCHTDSHYGQFEKNGTTNCLDCHNTEIWKKTKFDHSKAAFQLDGKHANVPCAKCHKPQQQGSITYIKYKLGDFRCESCHY